MATSDYASLQMLAEIELSPQQELALNAIISGSNDTQAAEIAKCHRVTVTNWRTSNPQFMAMLNRRRAEIWSNTADKLRTATSQAAQVIIDSLSSEEETTRLKAASMLLKLIPPENFTDKGSCTAEGVEAELMNQVSIAEQNSRYAAIGLRI